MKNLSMNEIEEYLLNQLKTIKNKNNIYTAFTLAEILITLGIIGVVAALTMPILIADVKLSRTRAQFKKGLSTVSQAMTTSKAKYDLDFANIDSECNGADDHPDYISSFCAIFNSTLKDPIFLGRISGANINKGFTNKSSYTPDYCGFASGNDDICISSNDMYAYALADGSIFAFPSTQWSYVKCTKENMSNRWEFGYSCSGFIDVNGFQGPNKIIRCKNKSDRNWENFASAEPCEISTQNMGDIIPIIFHDNIVEPASAAAKGLIYKYNDKQTTGTI